MVWLCARLSACRAACLLVYLFCVLIVCLFTWSVCDLQCLFVFVCWGVGFVGWLVACLGGLFVYLRLFDCLFVGLFMRLCGCLFGCVYGCLLACLLVCRFVRVCI